MAQVSPQPQPVSGRSQDYAQGGGGGPASAERAPSIISSRGENSSSGILSTTYPVVLVGQRFRLIRRLGGGAFGEVYEGYDTSNSDSVAVKLEPVLTNHHPHLNHEARLYQYLTRNVITVGIPRLRWYGVEGDYNVLVMDLLGPSVEELFEYCHRQFDLKSVFMIVEQMIQRLEFMHAMQYLHRDIKPENFVLGLGKRAHHVYVIDLGLAKRYWDGKAQKHIPFVTGKQLTGTARYVSLATHLGHQQSRRDDLESVAYVALYLAKGTLPWQGYRCSTKQEKYDRIMKAKQHTPIPELCSDLPPVFEQYLAYCRGLQFEEKPDYELCKNMWGDAVLEQGPRDYDYTWMNRRRQDLDTMSSSAFSTMSNTAVHMSGYYSKGSSLMQPMSFVGGSPPTGLMRR